MTASPLEARCEHCHDTGSLSQHMDGPLDCHYCEAANQRLAMRSHIAQFTGWPNNDTGAWAAYLFAQCQAAPVVAQPAIPKLPSTPEDVVAFIGDHFDVMDTVGDIEDRLITLTVHDLLSCFQNLADFAGEAAQPADPDDMAANYDHSTHDKRMEVLKGLRAAQPVGVAGQVPKAWMRKWYADGEIPAKVKGVWPKKFKFKSVTDGKIFPDDQPLYAAAQLAAQPSDDVALKAAVERMQKAHQAANAPAKFPAYDEAFEYQAAVHALIKAAVAKEKV